MTRDPLDRHRGALLGLAVGDDVGNTVAAALLRFRATGEPFAGSTDPESAGNGCLMRLAPIPMWFAPDLEAVAHHAALSSRTTHGAAECVDASRLFARLVARALADAFHGASAIPQAWLARLAMRDEITALADALAGGARRFASPT